MSSERDQLLPHSRTSGMKPNHMNSLSARVFVPVIQAWLFVKRGWMKAVKVIHMREVFAEFLGTFLLTVIGNGSIAQMLLGGKSFGYELSVNIGYAIGLIVGAYVAIGVSGGHLNPAVTLGMALRCKTRWIMVIPYWIAQMLGAFFSSAVIYGVYTDALHNYSCPDGSPTFKTVNCTGHIWATYPGQHLSAAGGVLDQVFGTFLLMFGVWAICDSDNCEPKAGLKPIALGFLIWGIGGSFGLNCGYAINPARDFAPRLFTLVAGYGKDVFVCSSCSVHHWWLIPLFAPMLGAFIATPVYWLLVEAHHPSSSSSGHSVNMLQNQECLRGPSHDINADSKPH